MARRHRQVVEDDATASGRGLSHEPQRLLDRILSQIHGDAQPGEERRLVPQEAVGEQPLPQPFALKGAAAGE